MADAAVPCLSQSPSFEKSNWPITLLPYLRSLGKQDLWTSVQTARSGTPHLTSMLGTVSCPLSALYALAAMHHSSTNESASKDGGSFTHLMALSVRVWLMNFALINCCDSVLRKEGHRKRALDESRTDWNHADLKGEKRPCWVADLSKKSTFQIRGEPINEGKELVDGAGESKSGDQDGGSEPITPPEPGEELQTSDAPSSSPPTESNDTVVEDSEEELQSEEQSNEDLIRKGRDIFIQAFNWESHKQQWWKLLREKVPQLAAWGFTSMWLPPAFESLAPQGYLPRNLYNLNSAYGSERELRNLLRVMRRNNVLAMADIVINHRVGSTRGVGDLYNRYDGMPMPWDEHAVTSDTGGLGNPSTGEIFKGIPNLDHTGEVVRNDLKHWLQWLRKDVGFNCFRFDFAKGFSPKFVKEYIEASMPRLAIGEYWDTCSYVGPTYILDYNQDSHRKRTVDWIDGTGGLACAFDFTTKAILQEACAKREWWRLRDAQGRPPGVLGMWPSRAITFIDNHDTGSTQAHWPFPREHVLQGYAYILTHPGQPCVFYDHLFEWGNATKTAILELMRIRRWQDIHSRSIIEILEANSRFYAALVGGNLCVKLGDKDWIPKDGPWELSTSGPGYAIWQRPKLLLAA